MPNRNVEGNYRYGYQGEFAEKEPELGNGQNSFELRLWDSRIGRWLTVDPYGQYHSPYMGMDNRPMSSTDPDGGSTDPDPIGDKLRAATGHLPPIEHQFYGGLDSGLGYSGSYFNAFIMPSVVAASPAAIQKKSGPVPDILRPSSAPVGPYRPSGFIGPVREGDFSEITEASIAESYRGDKRVYSLSNKEGTIDCSRLTRDVACQMGYSIPRVAYDQEVWYQNNGEWTTDLNQAQPGDHIFWERGVKARHTGIVLSVTTTAKGVKIIVIQAQVNGYRPGSIKVQRLMPNGEMKGFNQPFVGLGRYKY